VRASEGHPVRLRFCKRGKVRFISHRDVARVFERAFRARALPLAFTQGFSPRPKVSFGLALSVGHESDAEYLDLELREPVDPASLVDAVSDVLPEGMRVTGAVDLVERAPSLQEAVTAVEYRITLTGAGGRPVPHEPVERAIDRVLAASSLNVTRTRKGREIVEDVRSIIRELAIIGSDDPAVVLGVQLATQPRGARPADILSTLELETVEARVLRTKQWIERDGARLEPLEADARPRVPEARAS
jgi:radical SAM-linked protein